MNRGADAQWTGSGGGLENEARAAIGWQVGRASNVDSLRSLHRRHRH